MKKNTILGKLLAAATAGVLALSLIAGGISSFASPGRAGFVGEAKAKQIALSNSGLKESEVTFVRTTLELEKGNYEYEVEFYKGAVEHDYKIDAKTGRILEYDKDIENFSIPVNTANNENTGNTANTTKTENQGTLNNQSITAEKAKELALKHAGLKLEEVKFIKVELDKERGFIVYDVEFYKGNIEYDFEIDAKTGKVLKFDYDVENYTIPGTSVSEISLEKAKEIALKQAGVDAAKAKFVKAEIDIEHGVLVYDIEFYVDNTEYDFEIDAKTGEVREFDKDIENFVIQNIENANAGNSAVTLEQAKEIALKHVGLSANQVTFTKAKMDKDDGKSVYDIEFKAGAAEYDFEIDVQTGRILDYDYDLDDDRWDDRDGRDFDRDDDDDDDEWDD